jgi:predicted DNA-binding protein (MmcQ/YjbR family)
MATRSKAPAPLRKICLALPEAREVVVEAWGDEPTFRVNDKVFCFAGPTSMTVKVSAEEKEALLGGSRFTVPRYLTRGGWVSMDLSGDVDWDEVDELVRTSFCLIAPKRLAKLVDPTPG